MDMIYFIIIDSLVSELVNYIFGGSFEMEIVVELPCEMN